MIAWALAPARREMRSFWDLRLLLHNGELDAFCEAVRAHPQIALDRDGGRCPTLLFCLFQDLDIGGRGPSPPPLHLDEAKVVNVIRALLEIGEDPNDILPLPCRGATHPPPDGALAALLHLQNRRWASPDGAEAMVRVLLAGGADPNQWNREAATPLVSAARQGEITLFKLMVQAGARVNPDAKGPAGAAGWPLLEAWRRRAGGGAVKDTMGLLVEAGADVNAAGKNPQTGSESNLLYEVLIDCQHVMGERLDTAAWLVRTGADAAQYGPGGNTPLHGLCRRDPITGSVHLNGADRAHRAVGLLLSAGADINALNENGDSALNCAVREGAWHLAVVLIKAGADPNTRRTPLLWLYEGAASFTRTGWTGRRALRQALLEAGADINATHPYDGVNLLQRMSHAPGCPVRDLREVLVAGADPAAGPPFAINLYLDACLSSGTEARASVLGLLLDHGSPAPYTSWWGRSPTLDRTLTKAGLTRLQGSRPAGEAPTPAQEASP